MAARSKTCSGGENTAQLYRDSLELKERARYEEKLAFIRGLDPFHLGPLDTDYLIFNESAYTADDLKNYKRLDAYNQLICGWVREMQCMMIEGNSLVNAKVSISYCKS